MVQQENFLQDGGLGSRSLVCDMVLRMVAYPRRAAMFLMWSSCMTVLFGKGILCHVNLCLRPEWTHGRVAPKVDPARLIYPHTQSYPIYFMVQPQGKAVCTFNGGGHAR